jgi:hypothetical protein
MAQRPANPHRYEVPTIGDVAMRLRALIDGAVTRAEVAAWAAEYILYDNPQLYPKVGNERVWRALAQLAGVDLPSTDRPFLYGECDFRHWLRELGEVEGQPT